MDFGRHSDDYGRFRPGLPASFYDRLETLRPLRGASVLDLGTGPGHSAVEMARRGADVVGCDISSEQVRVARERARGAGLEERCRFRQEAAEEVRLDPESIDLVLASQSWWWFDADRTLRHVFSLLRPGGLLVAASFSYMPRLSEVAAATESLVLEMNPTWPMADQDGLHPELIDGLARHGFVFREQFSYDHDQPFTHEAWRGRVRTCNGVGSGGMTPEQVVEFDRRLADLLQTRFPRQPLEIRHRIWATIVQKPRSSELEDPERRS